MAVTWLRTQTNSANGYAIANALHRSGTALLIGCECSRCKAQAGNKSRPSPPNNDQIDWQNDGRSPCIVSITMAVVFTMGRRSQVLEL